MAFQIITGQTGVINPATTIINSGWTAYGDVASHAGCNSGTMTALNAFGLQVGRAYVFTYEISNYTDGGVRLIAGTNNGTYFTANGTNTQELVMTGNDFLSFYSDGDLSIGELSFYDAILGPQSGRTISFHETKDKWVSEKSSNPEVYLKFNDKLFTFFEGGLWQENVNPIMNNFYGVQYNSQVMFIFNGDSKTKKLWYNLRLDSTGNWYVANITIPPDDQFPNGMQTKMSLKNMSVIDGKRWADILRDMTDPNFNNIPDQTLRQAVAMFQGRVMQGSYIIVTLQCDDPTPATLLSAEAYYTDVKKSL